MIIGFRQPSLHDKQDKLDWQDTLLLLGQKELIILSIKLILFIR